MHTLIKSATSAGLLNNRIESGSVKGTGKRNRNRIKNRFESESGTGTRFGKGTRNRDRNKIRYSK